jgi:hypothetical protein
MVGFVLGELVGRLGSIVGWLLGAGGTVLMAAAPAIHIVSIYTCVN